MASPLTVRGIESKKYRINEYVNLNIYLLSKLKNIDAVVTAHITRETHIIKGFKINVLAGVNLLAAEGFIINLTKKTASINNCKGITIELTIIPRINKRLHRSILFIKVTTIPAYTRAPVKIQY
jgi:hypothetical protein